ncbi:endosome-associated-trafficking regulator 1 [Alligator mississippiensis]|uniref:endosome-associated-trafficking regulator 1 n=1 Tax=Alligator mississippiensis TaxID=8496 RepID=UPI0028774DA3|nr:endosome-associated-trafficking regulator 1 [Alligator mississippiensis]
MAARGGEAGPEARAEAERNPFSFCEFLRSQSRGAQLPHVPHERLARSRAFAEPFFDDPRPGRAWEPQRDASLSSGEDEEEEEEEDDGEWSASYRPSAHEEEAAALGAPGPAARRDSLPDLSLPPPPAHGEVSAAGDAELCEEKLGGGQSVVRCRSGRFGVATWGWFLCVKVIGPNRNALLQLKEENAKLRSKIHQLQILSEAQVDKVRKLEKKLEENKIKEQKEAQDLEAMVQHVEQNLQLMTKRAVKAEKYAAKLKQENAVLQVQLKHFKTENEALKSGQSASLAIVKQNAEVALQNLLTVITNSQSSIKQLVSGAESLQLVAELLKSIDRISEISEDGP